MGRDLQHWRGRFREGGLHESSGGTLPVSHGGFEPHGGSGGGRYFPTFDRAGRPLEKALVLGRGRFGVVRHYSRKLAVVRVAADEAAGAGVGTTAGPGARAFSDCPEYP